MLDPHYRSALRTSAFAEDPLVASRRDFRPTPPARLDTTPFVRSPAQVIIDDVKDALLHGATPGKPMPPSVKSVSTPTYSRAGGVGLKSRREATSGSSAKAEVRKAER